MLAWHLPEQPLLHYRMEASMKESIGQVSPDTQADIDQDGVADEAERDFEEISQVQPSPADAPPSPARGPKKAGEHAAEGDDDEALLESARKSSGHTAPGASN
jgi:hypothetical protein